MEMDGGGVNKGSAKRTVGRLDYGMTLSPLTIIKMIISRSGAGI